MLIDIDTFLSAPEGPILDVRSPSEYARGHVPGAVNIPLFNDAERAEVGTAYSKLGRQAALIRGLALVGGKAEQLLLPLKDCDPGQRLLVHCWRGGMRSESFAWLLDHCDFQTHKLSGGYKAFRQAAHRSFSETRRIIILAGASGTGKTRLLGGLRAAGEQVIDLERLACHRGSVFGGIEQPPQPSVEQFENELFLQWRNLDPCEPVWIECESRTIGNVFIPQSVWNQMEQAPAIFIEVPRERRIDFLVEEYGRFPVAELAVAIEKISKRIGRVRLQVALAALARNDLHAFAACALEFYDKAYAISLQERPCGRLNTVPLSYAGDLDSVKLLIQLGKQLSNVPETTITFQ